MKKVLIIAALMVAGIVANAASFKWTAANIKGHDGTTAYGGAVSLYAYAQGSDISTAILATTGNAVAGVIKDGSTVGLTFSNDSLAGGTTYQFYMVIEDGGYTLNTATISTPVVKSVAAQATATSNVAFGSMANASAASNWQGGDTPGGAPEPTSGLLLLLGMSGLALKRKIA